MGDDFTYSLNLYGGQVKNSETNEEHDRLIGAVAIFANDEYGEIRLNANQSKIDDVGTPQDGKDRTMLSAGIRGDWNNVVFYGEFAHSEIDNISNGDVNSWYTTIGYRFGKTMPHITYQDYDADTGVEQNSWTLGVKQTLTPSTALKLEVQQVSDIKQGGLFEAQPNDSDVYLFNVALNFVF